MRIDEIKSSPSRLKKIAEKLNALVGIEFELVVMDAVVPASEPEPDYTGNETVTTTSWDALETDITNFFFGDYNSRRAIDRALAKARMDFDRYIKEAWLDYVDEHLDRWVADNQTEDEFLTADDFKRSNYDDWFSLNEEKLLEGWVEYQGADLMNGEWINGYGLEWPLWSDSPDDINLQSIAQSFAEYVNMDVDNLTSIGSSKSYHMTDDASIIVRDENTEAGLEFISPPLDLTEMINHIQAVKHWAQDGNAYTNRSCGLHINVSLPNYTRSKLDYVKLVLFSADEHTLKQFGRTVSTYAASASDIIKRRAGVGNIDMTSVFENMRKKMLSAASNIIHKPETDKYVSINVHDNRVEFRSPGGDWLDMDIDLVINTVVRFVVALDIALDPNRYQEEYARKFYKLISPNKISNSMAMFSLLQSNSISIEQFKKIWAQTVAKNPKATSKHFAMADRILNRQWTVLDKNGNLLTTVTAPTEQDAKQKAFEWILDNGFGSDWPAGSWSVVRV